MRHIQDVAEKHESLLDKIKDKNARFDKLCELNVIEQTINVCQTTVVQTAWAEGLEFTVHGLIYSLQGGLLRDLSIGITNEAELQAARQKAISQSG